MTPINEVVETLKDQESDIFSELLNATQEKEPETTAH